MADILLLDAMGVLYQAGDDVAELLVPFVRKHGTLRLTDAEIERLYTEASLGNMDPKTFWDRVGVPARLENSYLTGHRLIDGTETALPALRKKFDRLACLSNDVSSWSRKLRRRFALEQWIDAWFISGDMRLRKPSPDIYLKALAELGAAPRDVTFVDDRPRNLGAAQQLGLHTVLLDTNGTAAPSSHRHIRSLAELL